MSFLQWTEPPELTTAATNLVIVIICLVCAARIIRIRQAGDLRLLFWALLFAILVPTGVYGFVVHAFLMEPETKRIAWIFLSVLLGLATTSLAVALLFEIFGRAHLKAILICNGAAEFLFAVVVCFLSKKSTEHSLGFYCLYGSRVWDRSFLPHPPEKGPAALLVVRFRGPDGCGRRTL